MVAQGLLEVTGQTNSVHVRLTVSGTLATWAGLYPDRANPEQVIRLVRRIGRMATVETPYHTHVVLGDAICKREKLSDLSCVLIPAVLCQWLKLWHSPGELWAAEVTGEGRSAAVPDDLPDIAISEADWQTYDQAVEIGLEATPPPSGSRRTTRTTRFSALIGPPTSTACA